MRAPDSRGPAYRVETERLVLRCWTPGDAPTAQIMMARSDAHLRRFIPMTTEQPRTLDEMAEWLREKRASFDRDEHYRYALFDTETGTMLGEALLLDREQNGQREVGYWVDIEQCGRGYATESTAAMLRLAFDVDGVDEVALRCAPDNPASIAVARKLGFEHTETRESKAVTEDRPPKMSLFWRLTRQRWAQLPVSRHAFRAYDCLDRAIGPLA